jgi:hypothetical protein
MKLDETATSYLFRRAYEYFYARQEQCHARFQIGRYQLWNLDPAKNEATFGSGSGRRILAAYDDIGSFSRQTATWSWAWTDKEHNKTVVAVDAVREYGKGKGIAKLASPQWVATEADAWEMAAISAYILQAEAVHSRPFEAGSVQRFFALSGIRWMDQL